MESSDLSAHAVSIDGRQAWDDVAGRFFAAAQTGMAVLEPATGAILDANPAFCAFLRRSREDLLALTIHDVTPPEDREIHGNGVPRRTLDEPAPPRLERRFLRGDGTQAWGALTITPLPESPGTPRIDVAHVEDITRRRQAGLSGAEPPLAQRWLLEQVPAAVFIHPLDADLPPTYISPRIEAVTGYRPDELMTRRDFLIPFVHEDDVAAVATLSSQTDRTLEPFVADYRIRRKDGHVIWLHNATEVVRDEDGTPLHWQGMVLDVTAQKDAEAELAAREAQFRSAFEDAAIGMTLVGPDGRFLDANPALCRYFGYPRDELMRLTFQEITHPDDLDADLAEYRRVLAGEIDGYRLDKRFLRKDGEIFWGRLTVACVRDEAGKVASFVSQVEDVTAEKHAEQALRALQMRFDSLVERIPAAVAIYPIGSERPSYVSPRAEALIGYTPDEIRDGAYPVHPDDAAAFAETGRRTARTLEPYSLVFRIRHKDGHWVWLHEESEIVRDETGRPQYWLGIFLDVTAEKELQRALADSEALFRSTFEAAGVGIVLMSPEGVFIDVNPAVCRTFGYDRSEPIGRTGPEFMHPEEVALDQSMMARVWSGEIDSYSRERRFRHKDGHWLWARATTSVLRDDHGAITRAVGIIEDITAEKAAKQALADSEALFRSTFDDSAIGMAVVGPDAHIFESNRALAEMLGYPPDELRGTTYHELSAPEFAQANAEAFARLASGESDAFRLEKQYIRKDGTRIWGSLHVSAVRDGAGHLVRAVSQVEDITVRKAAEAALQASEAQFRSVFEDAAIGMAIVDADATTLDANPAFCRMLGYTREEMRTVTYREVSTPSYVEVNGGLFGQLQRGERDTYHIDKEYLRKDGTTFWGSLNVSAVRDADGRLLRAVTQIEDVTAEKAAKQALAASEALFRSAFEDAAIGMALADPHGRMLEVNPALCRMLGYTEDELRRLGFPDFTHPDDLPAELALFQRMLAGEIDSYLIEKRHLRKDGSVVWCRVNASCVREPDGGTRRVIGQIEDISAVKEAQEALARSEAFFRASFEEARLGMASAANDGRLLDVNPALCALLGYTREELVGRTHLDITHPDDRAATAEMVRAMVAGETNGFRVEKRFLRKDGSPCWVRVNVAEVRGADGMVERGVSQVEDISAEKAAEQALAKSEQRFRALVERSSDATLVYTPGAGWTWISPALRHIIGYVPEVPTDDLRTHVIHPDDLPAADRFNAAIDERPGAVASFECRLHHADGSWRWVEIVGANHIDNPAVGGIVYNVREIAERKQAEQAMARALELEQRANAELTAAASQRAEFLSMLAHDFRTPLTAIQGYGDLLLLDSDDPASVREYAATISGSAERLNRLVTDMLAVETMEARLGQLRLAPADVAALVADAVHALRGAWPGRDIAVDARPGIPEATVDPDQVTQAVTNLVGNALKYSPGGEPVTVSIRQDGPAIEIAVTDRGIGIPPDKLERIFDKYARIRSKETQGIEGVGLGLPIVRAIARAHGGDAWAESAPGEGSTFRLRLPLVPSAEGAPAS